LKLRIDLTNGKRGIFDEATNGNTGTGPDEAAQLGPME